jgi:hypothetical protein
MITFSSLLPLLPRDSNLGVYGDKEYDINQFVSIFIVANLYNEIL